MTFVCLILGFLLIYWATMETVHEPLAMIYDPQEIDTGLILFPGTTLLPPGSLKLSMIHQLRKLVNFYSHT